MANSLRTYIYWLLGIVIAGAAAYATGVLDPMLRGNGPAVTATGPQPVAAPAAKTPPASATPPAGAADSATTAKGDKLPGGQANAIGNSTAMTGGKPAASAAAGNQPGAAQPGAAQPNGQQPGGQQMAAVPASPAPAGDRSGQTAPVFDIVRVEPDGSLVIAGKSQPFASVEIVTGSSVIGRGEAQENGDFAVVLDDRLKPGDYSIVLRTTTRDAVVKTSQETAVVSVPDQPGGQVLALVEAPGAPSRLITLPQAPAAAQAAGKTNAAASTPGASIPAGTAPAGTTAAGTAPAGTAAAGNQTAGNAAANGASAPANTAPVDTRQLAGAPVPAPAGETASAPNLLAPANGGAPAGTVAGAAPAGTVPGSAPGTPAAGAQIAAVPEPRPQTIPQAAPVPSAKPKLAVEAVEIEGNRVFVAGRAEPGARIRVYANDMLLGDAKASDGGRFLVETVCELAAGDYIIRADMIGNDAKVIARAAVPFEREAGENQAAVAAPDAPAPAANAPAASGASAAAGAKPVQPQSAPAQQQAAVQPAPSSVAPAGQPTKPSTGTAQGASAAPAAPAAGTPSTAGPNPPAAAPKATAAAAPATTAAPANATPATATPPAGTQQQAAAPAASSGNGGGTAAAGFGATVPATSSPAADAVTAPKLQNVGGSVIIRRGDTLWRISKRVYGRGVRYTTIYVANQEQISDPDRIWPGQVFAVPDKTDKGEAADMSAVADRIAPGAGASQNR